LTKLRCQLLSYSATLASWEKSILDWADPDNVFRGMNKGWFLSEFETAFTIALGYFLFVVIGSSIMKAGVAPIDPYPIKFFYNVSQIMLCAYMTIEAGLLAYRNGYSFFPCNSFDSTNGPVANLLWMFYVSKAWDFWDTIFIVLGKKWRQLSFLHVYHHLSIFMFYWLNSHVNYDGDIYLTIMLNGFIHTVMYTYYFICMHTRDPKTGKSLPIWWKSSLTGLQLVQFVTMMSQGSTILYKQCSGVPLRVSALYVVYILSLFVLFLQFFIASYIKPSKKKAEKKMV